MTSQPSSGQQQIAYTCQFGVICWSRFLDSGSIDLKTVCRIRNGDSSTSSFVLWYLRRLCFLTPKMGLKETSRRLRTTHMAQLDCLEKLLKRATHRVTYAYHQKISTYVREMTSSTAPDRQQIAQCVNCGHILVEISRQWLNRFRTGLLLCKQRF